MKIAFLDTVHPVLRERLEDKGIQCDEFLDISKTDILSGGLSEYHGIVLRSRITIDSQLIDSMPNLKWIARSGSGIDNIDTVYAKKKDIQIFSSPEGNKDAVGEHGLGRLLNLLNNLRSSDTTVRNKQWLREEHRGRELKSLTVGIYGYGVMGSSFAEKLSGLKCEVIAYDKYKTGFSGEHVIEVSEAEFFEKADIASIHVPWTAETKQLVDSGWLARFSKPIIIMNTSRGAVVVTRDLLDALDSGRVTAAALDVLEFEGESLEELELNSKSAMIMSRLLNHENVLLSPHVAGWTVESYFKLSSVLADKILGIKVS